MDKKIAIVTFYDADKDEYTVVDGFHRYRCAKEYFKLKEIPVVVIDKPLDNRMASTIRHNRARGTHQIKDMSIIVKDLTEMGWDDEKICKELGMDLDEVIRLKQITGLKEAFQNHDFSKSWEEFELLDSGHAYIAFDTPEQLEKKRAEVPNFQYDARTRGAMI